MSEVTLLGGKKQEFYRGDPVHDFTRFWWWNDDGVVLWSDLRWVLPEDPEVDKGKNCESAILQASKIYGRSAYESYKPINGKMAFHHERGWFVFDPDKRVRPKSTEEEHDEANQNASSGYHELRARTADLFLDFEHEQFTKWNTEEIAEAHAWFDANKEKKAGPMPEHLRRVVATALYKPSPSGDDIDLELEQIRERRLKRREAFVLSPMSAIVAADKDIDVLLSLVRMYRKLEVQREKTR